MKRIKNLFVGDTAGGMMLMVSAVLSMLIMNSALSDGFVRLLHVPFRFGFGDAPLALSVQHWINDGLMAIFFLLIGLELKREIKSGYLSKIDQLILPAVAAVGGMCVPALIYTLFNVTDPVAAHGWAVPAATDIAFALGIISLLGSRVPMSAKVFLITVAVVDDLGAILVIALFYTVGIDQDYLALSGVCVALMVLFNALSCRLTWVYMLFGAFLWYFMLKSGVHATLAGVITGLCVPYSLPKHSSYSPLHNLEIALVPVVSFLVLPLFGLSNAGISLAGFSADLLLLPVSLGVSLGLLFGKPLGIFAVVWLLSTCKIIDKPSNTSWHHIFGVSILAGVGFTMSLFISNLAFDDEYIQALSRLGILTGSLFAGVMGFLYLRFVPSGIDINGTKK